MGLQHAVITYCALIAHAERYEDAGGLADLRGVAAAGIPAWCDHLLRSHPRMLKDPMTRWVLLIFVVMRLLGLHHAAITYHTMLCACGKV